MRFLLAIKCFFRVWFGRKLPDDARLLPLLPAAAPAPAPAPAKELPAPEKELPAPAPAPVVKQGPDGAAAVQLLALLQREGRLLDVLEEPIDSFTDAQIGGAVRSIHKGCKKVLDQVLVLGPALAGAENAAVEVAAAPIARGAVKLVGNVAGSAPFKGVLRHPGWATTRIELPAAATGQDPLVIAPAEVELS